MPAAFYSTAGDQAYAKPQSEITNNTVPLFATVLPSSHVVCNGIAGQNCCMQLDREEGRETGRKAARPAGKQTDRQAVPLLATVLPRNRNTCNKTACLSVRLSVCLFDCLPVGLSFILPRCLPLSVTLDATALSGSPVALQHDSEKCISVCLCPQPTLVCLLVCLPASLPVSLPSCLSHCLSASLPVTSQATVLPGNPLKCNSQQCNGNEGCTRMLPQLVP